MTMTTVINARAISVVMVIFTVENDQLRVLLIRRSAEPAKGSWSLPGGLLGNSESLEAAAIRKLQDETGLSDVFLEQLYTFADLDKRGSIAIAYFALVDSGQARLAQRKAWLPAWKTHQRSTHPGPGQQCGGRLRATASSGQTGLFQCRLQPPATGVQPVAASERL